MASKKKGLSIEEKRSRLLQLFYETKEIFQMKELEKIAPKEKGIVLQSVKDVTQSLVDDGLIECEKIGTIVCFWAFPSKAATVRKTRLEDLDEKISQTTKKIEEAKSELNEAKVGKEESEDRAELLKRLSELREKQKILSKKLEILSESGPEAIAAMSASANEALEAANRWTDNIYSIKKWCKTKFGMDEKTLNEQFQVPSDLDYVE